METRTIRRSQTAPGGQPDRFDEIGAHPKRSLEDPCECSGDDEAGAQRAMRARNRRLKAHQPRAPR